MYEITNAKCANTGGGCYVFWGKTKESFFMSNLEDGIGLYNADTNEYMDKYLSDENFDAYEWEETHQIDSKDINRQFIIEVFEALEETQETKSLKEYFLN